MIARLEVLKYLLAAGSTKTSVFWQLCVQPEMLTHSKRILCSNNFLFSPLPWFCRFSPNTTNVLDIMQKVNCIKLFRLLLQGSPLRTDSHKIFTGLLWTPLLTQSGVEPQPQDYSSARMNFIRNVLPAGVKSGFCLNFSVSAHNLAQRLCNTARFFSRRRISFVNPLSNGFSLVFQCELH